MPTKIISIFNFTVESIGQGYIIVREVFGLNDKTRSYAERWIKWANENKDKAVGLI